MREYYYLIEKDDKKVTIKFKTFKEMIKTARNYKSQGVGFDCYSVQKKELLLTGEQLKEK